MGRVLAEAEVFAGGKAIIALVSQKMLDDIGARMEDTEGIVGTMRSIKGIDIAILVKEKASDNIKISLRAKEGDVASIAVSFGGGGHEKAAGCTLYEDIDTASSRIKAAVLEALCKE